MWSIWHCKSSSQGRSQWFVFFDDGILRSWKLNSSCGKVYKANTATTTTTTTTTINSQFNLSFSTVGLKMSYFLNFFFSKSCNRIFTWYLGKWWNTYFISSQKQRFEFHLCPQPRHAHSEISHQRLLSTYIWHPIINTLYCFNSSQDSPFYNLICLPFIIYTAFCIQDKILSLFRVFLFFFDFCHHHHVPEGLGVLSCSLILKMKLVPPPLP